MQQYKKLLFILFMFICLFIPNNNVYAEDLTNIDNIPVVYMPIDINYSKDVTIVPKFIIIHDTGNRDKGATARNNRNYFANTPSAKASTQFVVDDTEIVQVLPETAMAWHIGDGVQQTEACNSNSIGIELCVNSDGDFGQTFQNGIKLTKYLMKKYNIPAERVIRHYDATKKICPRIMIEDDPSLWTKFKDSISTVEENTSTDNTKTNKETKTEETQNETTKEVSIYDKLLEQENSEKEKYKIPSNPNSRIINNDVFARLQPSNDTQTKNYITQGSLVEVVEKIGDTYCKVKFNDTEVYVPSANVELLPEYKYSKNGQVIYTHNFIIPLTKIFSFGIIGDRTSGYGND